MCLLCHPIRLAGDRASDMGPMTDKIVVSCRKVGSDVRRAPSCTAFELNVVWVDASIDDVGDSALAVCFIIIRILIGPVGRDLFGLGDTLESPGTVLLSYPLAMSQPTDWFDG